MIPSGVEGIGMNFTTRRNSVAHEDIIIDIYNSMINKWTELKELYSTPGYDD